MRILWTYLKPHRWLVVLSLLLAGISQVLTMVDPVIFGKIIDNYAHNVNGKTPQELVQGVLGWMGIAIGIALLARLAKSIQEYTMRLVVQKFGMQVFNDGLKQTLRLTFQEYEDQRSGETLALLQKVRTDTEKFINALINILFTSIVGMAFLIWYAITKHWALIPIFIIGIIVLGGLTGLLSKRMKTVQRSINRETLQLSGAITESLRNIELVKSLGLTYPEIKRLRLFTQKIFDLEMQKTRQVRTLSFLQGTTLNVLRQSILFALLWLIFHNVLSTGELIAMQFITTSIFGPLQDLGNIILQYREAEASLQLFDKLMKQPVEQKPEEPVEIGPLEVLRFNNVVFRHKTAMQNAIDDISFEVKTGETIAFVGPSGSGKSTLVKLLVGLYKPVSGGIYFNEVSSADIRFNPLRRQIGFVTQDTQLFAGTIKDNLLFVKPDATDEEVLAALHKASCDALLARSANGIYTRLGEGGLKLSGGERQRISIARALIRNPRLLIFDEATSALDSLTEEVISDTIRTISERREQITLLIAHRLSTIMHADRIIVLEKGSIAETGTHQELVEKKGLYYAMWRQQIGERRPLLTGSPEMNNNSKSDSDSGLGYNAME
ncbi:ATP-binding cassette, subfamily B [Filimonas lacunae]|uniref:ATP-binding cassette, subfamily B n=1 Tax=Filimonas lacunae TaxID=477680 RepID=A0A173MF27_9BACT|nr:ABC transporter ATP-binding protein [Filimonas lacunae]BAV06038.1 lipid A export ATP-binding/permease protein MsbA [Filimonas lacunae]SIT24348.1 ATP-binding cassette, subfamily B [Filimonas lacunae]